MKKTITISIPCWNEEKNVLELVNAIEKQFQTFLPEYNYIIQFSDNCSTDGTRQILRDLCKSNPHVRAIFNVSNVSGSAIHSILQMDGECCIHMACDFQDPPELIPQLVREWENGAQIVCAIKKSSDESKKMWFTRTLYYKIMSKFSSIPQIEHFTGFGLYDSKFVEIIRRIDDPLISLRGLVAEYGHNVSEVYYKQPIRKHGKSKKNFVRNYDYAMRNFTTYTSMGIHLVTFVGVFLCGISLVTLFLFILLHLITKYSFVLPAVIMFMLFLYSTLLIVLGVMGAYILNMNIRLLNRPLAIEAERIGFDKGVLPKPENSNPYNSYMPTDS